MICTSVINNNGHNNMMRCKFCYDTDDLHNEFITPCLCNAHVHRECLNTWIYTSINPSSRSKCEVCLTNYQYEKSEYYKMYVLKLTLLIFKDLSYFSLFVSMLLVTFNYQTIFFTHINVIPHTNTFFVYYYILFVYNVCFISILYNVALSVCMLVYRSNVLESYILNNNINTDEFYYIRCHFYKLLDNVFGWFSPIIFMFVLLFCHYIIISIECARFVIKLHIRHVSKFKNENFTKIYVVKNYVKN